MKKERKEIGYYNTSTREVIPGYSVTYNALSSKASELDENGMKKFVENINGQPRELTANVKGQLMLDRERRGGERLWQRIYDEADLVAKLEARGIQVAPDKPKLTIEQKANLSEQGGDVTTGGDESDLGFKSVVDEDETAFDA